jgi:serine/threonine protein kinase/Tfp pilus assembly protein PilF
MPGLRSSISAYVDRWRQGEAPSAHAVLREHPELASQKSVVLDLAYEEFCLRTEAGEQLAPSTFCNQFPTYRKSLERLLGVHELLAGNPAFAALTGEIAWPAPGDEFLGFQLRDELGQGALGRVFLATEPALGNRLVVLKLALEGGREAEILGKLSHAHIVPVHSVQQDDETRLTAVCMPFLGTATLCDVIDRTQAAAGAIEARVILEAARDDHGPATDGGAARANGPLQLAPSYVNAVLRIGRQLADALRCAHSQGILHRDLKPSNVLLTSSAAPMLLDFNLSSDAETRSMRVGGTLPYAAPEQLAAIFADQNDGDDKVDARSDLFSLGVVLYELLSGALPFKPPPLDVAEGVGSTALTVEASARAILARQAAGPVPLRSRCPSVDPAVAAIVERCLQFDPDRRPQSATELIELLERSLAPRRRVMRWSRRHWALSAASSIVVCVLLALGVLAVASRDPYYVAERKAGMKALAAHQLDEAIEHFTLALKDKPDDVEVLFGRGQAYQQKDDFVLAARDFETAAKYSSAGEIRAWAAYCWARKNLFGESVMWNRLALDSNYKRAEVFNNLGYSLFEMNQVSAARESFTDALHANPNFIPALYNRGLAELKLLNNNRIPLQTGLADFDRAINLDSPSRDLYFNAACLNALAPAAANRRQVAVSYLVKAIELGLPADRVSGERLLASCRDAPQVKAALSAPRKPQSSAPVIHLVAPPLPEPGSLGAPADR